MPGKALCPHIALYLKSWQVLLRYEFSIVYEFKL